MEWCKSNTGNDIITLNESGSTYASFGKEQSIKWIHLSFLDANSVRHGQLIPVTLNRVKGRHTTLIGKKNLVKLRGLIRDRLDGDILSRLKFYEVGEAINLEERSPKKGK